MHAPFLHMPVPDPGNGHRFFAPGHGQLPSKSPLGWTDLFSLLSDLTPGTSLLDQIVAVGVVESCRSPGHPIIGDKAVPAIAYDPAKSLCNKEILIPTIAGSDILALAEIILTI